MRIIRLLLLTVLGFLLAGACCQETTPVVHYQLWFNWPERYLPDFSTLGTPDLTGVKTNLDLEDLPDSSNHFAVLFDTELNVCKSEDYTFKLCSDDGTRFYVDGELLLDIDGAHGPILKQVTLPLAKGRHALRIEFFDYDKSQTLDFTYSTPTIPWQELNENRLKNEDALTSDDRFVMPQIEEAYARFAEWKGEDEVLCYPILTDIHTAGRFSYKHIGYAAKAAPLFGFDFMALLGDIGLNSYPATLDSVYAASVVRNTLEQMNQYDGIWLYAPGNHDWDAGKGKENYFTEEEVSANFQKPWQEKAGDAYQLVPGKTWGWYDVPGKDIRIILLNSTGTRTLGDSYYLFDEPQQEWLKGLLADTPKDKTVLVMAHYMPHPMGRWNMVSSVNQTHTLENNIRLMAVLSDFVHDGGTLAGMLCGDSHANCHVDYNDVDYYITQGYGWVSPDLMIEGTTHAFFDYRQMMCVDVIAVKPGKREVHTFRIGAGGADYDYQWTY